MDVVWSADGRVTVNDVLEKINTRERQALAYSTVKTILTQNTAGRQIGFLGEPRVNVLELNLDLDTVHPLH